MSELGARNENDAPPGEVGNDPIAGWSFESPRGVKGPGSDEDSRLGENGNGAFFGGASQNRLRGGAIGNRFVGGRAIWIFFRAERQSEGESIWQ